MLPRIRCQILGRKRREERLLYRCWLALLAMLGTLVFMAVFLTFVVGCWRGRGSPTCPNSSVTTTGGAGGGPMCEPEPKPRIVRARATCGDLVKLAGELPEPFALPKCNEDDLVCERDYYQYRAGEYQWWADRAIAVCSPEAP